MYTGEDNEDGNPYMLEEDPEVLRNYNFRGLDDKYPYEALQDPEVQRDLLALWNDDMSIEPMNDRERAVGKRDQILEDEDFRDAR